MSLADDAYTQFFGEAPPVAIPPKAPKAKPDRLSYAEELHALETFCDPEPHTMKHAPDYKPVDGVKVDRFHKVIDAFYCPHRRALVMKVFRPANPRCNSRKFEVWVTIPDFRLAELGVGIPGEWKFLNEGTQDDEDDTLTDPFADEE